MNPGERINGYYIQRLIGVGGMSEVYLASDKSGSQVAVKRLKDEYAADPVFVKRLKQEAEVLGSLRDSHVAQFIDSIADDREFLLVEEYLPGGSLADKIEAGPIPEKQALLWCRDALLGVNSAHQLAVLHRDLKPGNLMFDRQGNIKVTDFGIAKVFGNAKLTRTRSEMGTPAYMSPEQIRQPDKAFHLTDVYSMGVVLYEMLTRKVPFDRDGDYDTKEAVVKEPPPPPRTHNPSISRDLEKIVLKALRKDQYQRYGGCAEFAAAIDLYLQGKSLPFRPSDWIRDHPRLTAALLAMATLLIVIIFGAALRTP